MAAHSFETLKRERAFRNPPTKGHVNPTLDRLAAPHIESFNSPFDDSGLDRGDTDGRGLISLSLKEIGEKVVFSGNQSSSGNPRGARLACEHPDVRIYSIPNPGSVVWIDQVAIGRPMVPEKDRHSIERRIFPSEVSSRGVIGYI